MKRNHILILLTLLLLAFGLTACAGSGQAAQETDGEPDVSEMYAPPEDTGADAGSEDGTVTLPEGDTPLAGKPVDTAAYIQQVVDLVNKERAAKGLGKLTALPKIETAAATRAKELITSFSHTRPDGTKYRTALEANGVKAGYTGENVAMGYRTPEAVVKGWMNSTGHRDNILKSAYTHVGVGYAVDSKTGYAYWCLLLTSKPS